MEEKTKEMLDDKTKDILLKEYELCQASANRLEDTIWKTFSAIGIIAIAPLTFLVSKNLNEINLFIVAIISGAIVIPATWVWWNMALRWWDVQHTAFDRMVDIESELKYINQIHYVYSKDGRLDAKDKNLTPEQKQKLQFDPEFKKKGVKKSLNCFPYLVTFIWTLFILFVLFNKVMEGVRIMNDPDLLQKIYIFLGGIITGIIITLLILIIVSVIHYFCCKKYHSEYTNLLTEIKVLLSQKEQK